MRIEPYEQDKRLILQRYQRTCAVCDAQGTVDVAHLCEDATLRVAASDKLILLCPTCNQAQARAHYESAAGLPGSFDPAVLEAQGRVRYREGNFPLSYAKARLAAYLFETNKGYSEAVGCLIEAISAIRPLRWGDWLARTAMEVERLCTQHGPDVGPGLRWLFLDRLALVLYDYSRWAESVAVLLASMSISNCVQNNPYNPRQRESDRANSFRRQSLIKASTRKLDTGERVPKVLSNLNESAEEFLRLGQYDAFATTLDVARKIALEVAGDFEKAHGYSERVLSEENKITHKWVLQEHIASEAGYFYSKKDFPKAREYMCRAMVLHSKHPVVLEPVLTTDGPKRHDIHEDLRRIGIGYETLLVEGITIAPSIPEVPLALRTSDVRRIVRSVMST